MTENINSQDWIPVETFVEKNGNDVIIYANTELKEDDVIQVILDSFPKTYHHQWAITETYQAPNQAIPKPYQYAWIVHFSGITQKETIWYFGKELVFKTEIKCREDGKDMDEAQALLDYYQKNGKLSACTHYNNAHQVYAEK